MDATETIDTDLDGIGNNADTDDDGDTLLDTAETAAGTDPLLADSDADGVNDNLDAFPVDGTETIDTDADGVGNNADTDDDGDTLLDTAETAAGTNPLLADSDADGVNDNLDAFPVMAPRRLTPTRTASATTRIPTMTVTRCSIRRRQQPERIRYWLTRCGWRQRQPRCIATGRYRNDRHRPDGIGDNADTDDDGMSLMPTMRSTRSRWMVAQTPMVMDSRTSAIKHARHGDDC